MPPLIPRISRTKNRKSTYYLLILGGIVFEIGVKLICLTIRREIPNVLQLPGHDIRAFMDGQRD